MAIPTSAINEVLVGLIGMNCVLMLQDNTSVGITNIVCKLIINPKMSKSSFDALRFRRREGAETANRQVQPAAEDAICSEDASLC